MVNDGNSVPATGAPIALLSQTNTSLGGIICYCEAQTENISLTWQHKQTITETLSLCIRLENMRQ